jgi:endonuclease/exonuclease/phosphatase family metal-dependent hydrolase
MWLRKITKRLLVLCTWISAGLYLLAASAIYWTPSTWWPVALMGVTYFFWLILLLGLLVFWIVFQSRWVLLPILALAISFPVLRSFFALHPFGGFSQQKQAGSIRVMQWNVARWDEMKKYWAPGKKSKRMKMFEYIRQQQVDILCVQEYFESNNIKEFEKNTPYIVDSLGFPYHYFAVDHVRWDSLYKTGVAIFSKYPIVDTFRKRYGGPDSLKNNESLIYVDVQVQNQRIRVFTSHLQSMRFGGSDYQKLRELKETTDSVVEKSKGIVKKFRQAYELRLHQVNIIKPKLDQSKYPEIFCGDFNEVPTSFIYHQLKGDRTDAFTAGGFGIGRTFSSLSPTLRIDYILADPQFEVIQAKRDRVPLSDHFPVIADLRLQN